jgi:hypothetical protein
MISSLGVREVVMCAAKAKGRKPAKKKGKKKSASGNRLWPVMVALSIPAILVGGYLAYQSSAGFATWVDSTAGKASGVVANLLQGHEKGAADSSGETTVPADRRRTERRGPPEPPARVVEKDPAPVAEIPRQQPKPARASAVPLTVKKAQSLAVKLFGGRIAASTARPHGFWYAFSMDKPKKRYPYDVVPKTVFVSTVGLEGRFIKDTPGVAVFIKVEDPDGAQWTNSYIGTTLFSGTARKPGKILGSTAMQAPGGVVTRHEALDFEGDGDLELALEIESEAPGGYLMRDLALHSFTPGGTTVRWHARTLDDGPGVPLEEATFKNVQFVDADGDGNLDIRVESGKRQYDIARDMTRTLKQEKIVTTRVYRLSRGGKFRLAKR